LQEYAACARADIAGCSADQGAIRAHGRSDVDHHDLASFSIATTTVCGAGTSPNGTVTAIGSDDSSSPARSHRRTVSAAANRELRRANRVQAAMNLQFALKLPRCFHLARVQAHDRAAKRRIYRMTFMNPSPQLNWMLGRVPKQESGPLAAPSSSFFLVS